MSLEQGFWIWAEHTPDKNAFVRFRKTFSYHGGPAQLRITADSRYFLYVNGEAVGNGPVRAWPNHWRYDSYDLEPYLVNGENLISVLVNHYGEGTFQYIPAPPGLLAEIDCAGERIVTDASWQASLDPSNISLVPRVCVQEGFEEQVDGRLADEWTSLTYSMVWPAAVELRAAQDGIHNHLQERGIPFLTREPMMPVRYIEAKAVQSLPYIFSFADRMFACPEELSSNRRYAHGYFVTRIYAPGRCILKREFAHFAPMFTGGLEYEESCEIPEEYTLEKGWNDIVINHSGHRHNTEMALALSGPEGLIFSCTGKEGDAPWAYVGPFALTRELREGVRNTMDESTIIVDPEYPTAEMGFMLRKTKNITEVLGTEFFHPLTVDVMPAPSVFLRSYTDRVTGDAHVDGGEGFVSGDWVTIWPSAEGDVRLLVDYGKECVGYQSFEIFAQEGVTVDVQNFENIQPDALRCYADGMNNAFRYICREGRQTYTTLQRRGLRYAYYTLRNQHAPVKMRNAMVIQSTYPQSNVGYFRSSDELLNKIWQVGADTMRCCAEDTYTDCPTYEQTHWVGDARNEALVDWAVNGDNRLWFRCLEQAGDSLERSPLIESQVPSGWQNILPAWTFLWMRSCREYMLFTGDRKGAAKLLDYVIVCIRGIEQRINDKGLFETRGWNMFDWAAMDTPNVGAAITHLNCFAVWALHDVSELAGWLGEQEKAHVWGKMADSIKEAVNRHLWVQSELAFTDCIRDGVPSKVFSQQTHTVAYMSGVAEKTRGERCRSIVYAPPEGFVTAGSPFFEFFLLEAFQKDELAQEFLETIRKDWGFMVQMGATTFWEQWTAVTTDGRMTRSHCHGWSAAPTYFLTTYVLGIRPLEPGFSRVLIHPHAGDLEFCQGAMPLPDGRRIEVHWMRQVDGLDLYAEVPDGIALNLQLPSGSSVTINGARVEHGNVIQQDVKL